MSGWASRSASAPTSMLASALLGLATAVSAAAATGPRPSLDQLAAMQLFLRAEIQGPSLCPEETRGLPSEGLAALPQRLLAELHERWGSLSLAERESFFADEARIAACRARCRCETYLDWLEGETRPSAKLAEARLRIARAALPKAKGRARACAEANRGWVCRHPYFRELIETGKRGAASEG